MFLFLTEVKRHDIPLARPEPGVNASCPGGRRPGLLIRAFDAAGAGAGRRLFARPATVVLDRSQRAVVPRVVTNGVAIARAELQQPAEIGTVAGAGVRDRVTCAEGLWVRRSERRRGAVGEAVG